MNGFGVNKKSPLVPKRVPLTVLSRPSSFVRSPPKTGYIWGTPVAPVWFSSFNHKVPWAAVQIFVLGRVHSGILNKMVFGWKLGVPIWKHFFYWVQIGGGREGVRKNKHNNYVVNVNKKEQVKQIKMFSFAEAFLHSHDSRILLDFMTIYNCFSIKRQRKREAKEIPGATGGWWTVVLVVRYRF